MSRREHINFELSKARAMADKLGAVLDIDPEVFIDDDHLDPIWYGGTIGSIHYKGYELSIEVRGEVRVYGELDGNEFKYVNRMGNGAMAMTASDTLRSTFKNDDELLSALQVGDIAYEDNNWIEAFVRDPEGHWFGDSTVDDGDNVLESFCEVSNWVDFLDKEYIKDNTVVKEDDTVREIKTIESELYEKADDGIHLKHVGMISGQELFDRLYNHLKEVDLLPDEYFLQSHYLNQDSMVPDFSEAVCHTNWGSNEGIYIDIDLAYREDGQPKLFHLATGKTLSQDGDSFLHMSRIAAECSIMLNGRGTIVKISDKHYPDKGNEQDMSSLTAQIQSATSRAGEPNSIPEVKNIEAEHYGK